MAYKYFGEKLWFPVVVIAIEYVVGFTDQNGFIDGYADLGTSSGLFTVVQIHHTVIERPTRLALIG